MKRKLAARYGVMASVLGACALSFLPAADAAEAQEPAIELGFRYFAPKVSGSVHGSDFYSHYSEQNKLDYKDDLGIDSARAPEVRVRYGQWHVDYIGFRSSENHRLDAPIRHKSNIYKGNLDTDMDMDYLSLSWRHDMTEGNQNVYYQLGLTYLREKATSSGLNGKDEWQTERDNASGAVPTVGIGGVWQLSPKWRASASMQGMLLGSYGHVFDGDAGISWQPAEKWSLEAGWRQLDFKLHKDDKTAFYRARGPYFGVNYAF